MTNQQVIKAEKLININKKWVINKIINYYNLQLLIIK